MKFYITLNAEWIDIGTNYLAVLSPVQCNASEGVAVTDALGVTTITGATAITNASVRYYRLDTVPESGNFVKGWTC